MRRISPAQTYPCTVCRQDAGVGHEFKVTLDGRYIHGPPVCDRCYARAQRGVKRLAPDSVRDFARRMLVRQVPDTLFARAWVLAAIRGRVLL